MLVLLAYEALFITHDSAAIKACTCGTHWWWTRKKTMLDTMRQSTVPNPMLIACRHSPTAQDQMAVAASAPPSRSVISLTADRPCVCSRHQHNQLSCLPCNSHRAGQAEIKRCGAAQCKQTGSMPCDQHYVCTRRLHMLALENHLMPRNTQSHPKTVCFKGAYDIYCSRQHQA